MKKIIPLLSFLVLSVVCFSQDTIIKKNGDIIPAKIKEVGTDEVKFIISGSVDGPVITLKKSELKKVKVGNQTIIDETQVEIPEEKDVLVKKNGDVLNVKVEEIGTEQIKFKLANNLDGPSISIARNEIKSLKVAGQTIIDVKGAAKEDIIVKKDGSVLKVKVVELGAEEIKYKLANSLDGPMLTIKKSEVDQVKIDGQVAYKYTVDPRSVSNQAILNKTSAIKFHFFSPLNKHMAFGYEWMQRPGFNWEAGLGIIGPGVSVTDQFVKRKPFGTFVRFGPKFLLGSTSDFETADGVKYAHPLKGRYIKVEMILNTFKLKSTIDTAGGYIGNPSGKTVTYTSSFQSMSLNVGYGRQFIVGNAITISYYIGVGYSFEAKSSNYPGSSSVLNYDDDQLNRYSHTYYGKNFPLMTTARLSIGYIIDPESIFKNKKKPVSKSASRKSMDE